MGQLLAVVLVLLSLVIVSELEDLNFYRQLLNIASRSAAVCKNKHLYAVRGEARPLSGCDLGAFGQGMGPCTCAPGHVGRKAGDCG